MNITYSYRPNRNTQPKEINTFGERCFINTSARLYDPLIGRMLSPDNFTCPGRTIVSVGMQDATSTQGYNRYIYVLNNPLKYKDPDVDFIFTIATQIADPFTRGASSWCSLQNESIGKNLFFVTLLFYVSMAKTYFRKIFESSHHPGFHLIR